MGLKPAMSELLVISHAPSPKTQRLTDAVVHGASKDLSGELLVSRLSPFETEAERLVTASGIILGTTENFGYMSGAMKDFFDRIYYPCMDRTEGLPYALFVRAGNDGSGAVSSIERIVSGLGWKAIQPALVCSGEWQDGFVEPCEELGATMAAGLDMGIF